MSRLVVCLRSSLVVALGLGAFACWRGAPAALELRPNEAWKGELEFATGGQREFVLDVPVDTVSARITLHTEIPDLELLARPRRRVGSPADASERADGSEGPPTIVLDRFGAERVAGERWFFAVRWPYEGLPHIGDERVERTAIELQVETFAARVDGELSGGVALASALDADSGGFRTFKVVVPDTARTLRLDLFDVSSDLDLYAHAGTQSLEWNDDVAFAENNWGHETLLIDADGTPPLVPGAWFVDVYDSFGPTRTLPFKIVASFDREVPERLRGFPALPPPHGEVGLARALRAVVEIATANGLGSGTLLTRDGWILTNAHVVGDQGQPEIVVSLTLDPTSPAEELFRAELVRLDFERDLALIRVTSGIYGQALPRELQLPTLELGDARALAIGDPLWLVGYPATGGTGSRVTISATRGIVAGFERADFGVLIKTDAEITSGNSGGAALDEHGTLIGVPSSTVENGSGQIGYVHPIDALPQAWRALLAR